MTLTVAREIWGKIILTSAVAVACLLFLEIVGVEIVARIPRHSLLTIAWLRNHYDDRSLLHILIPSWFSSIALFVLSLFAIGSKQRKAFIVTASSAIGAPLLLYGFVVIDGWFR